MANPQVTPVTEFFHAGGFLVSESNGHRSRDSGLLASGQYLQAGTVLGKASLGAGSAVVGVSTGNGAMGAITVGSTAIVGVYVLKVTKAATNAGDFEVTDPNNEICGVGSIGTPFVGGGVSFTLADGATDFIVNDTWLITVAAGTGLLSPFDPTATNGVHRPIGILYGPTDATNFARPGAYIARAAEINASELVWGVNVTTAPQRSAALTALGSLGIIAR